MSDSKKQDERLLTNCFAPPFDGPSTFCSRKVLSVFGCVAQRFWRDGVETEQ